MTAAAEPAPCPNPGACREHEAHTMAGVGIAGPEPIPTIELRRSLTAVERADLAVFLERCLGIGPFDDVFELRFSKAGPKVVLEAELQDSARMAAVR